jgi:pimeloyl-ACP methyl ester carboxylesterase
MGEIPPLPELRFIGIDPARCGLEGTRVSYLESGSANRETVVLLHGIGSNAGGWRYVLQGLGASFRVIAWNAPGYMLSDNLAGEAPSNNQYADALAAFLDALAIDHPICLAGSSFGSMVAATFAARYPERLRRLALFGASRGQRWLSNEERAKRRRLREESIRDGALAMAEARWPTLLSASPTADAVNLTQEILKATNRRGFLQSVGASDTTDVLEFANTIAAPTLIVVGKEDRVNPPEISRAIQQAIPGSRFVGLDGVGHLAKLEAPERVIELLLAHFGEQS